MESKLKIVLFEDDGYTKLLPLVYFRAIWELRCGALTIEQKIERLLNQPCFYLARKYLTEYHLPESRNIVSLEKGEPLLLINGRWVMNPEDVSRIKGLHAGEALVTDREPLALRTTTGELEAITSDGLIDSQKVFRIHRCLKYDADVIEYLWDAIFLNEQALRRDYDLWAKPGKIEGKIYDGATIVNRERITIEKDALIKPGAVIDAEGGPVWIDEGATVMSNAVIEGPAYIGKKSAIKIGAKIYENTAIGPVCKIGGEVEESIVQGYSNKQHDGFLGHSYLGSWINIGADSNNSDLKNNYGFIKVYVNGEMVDTQKRFVGLMMGDHTKCAINTMFNTGTVVGVHCNIFGTGMPPKFVPSFSWGGAESMAVYNFEKAIEVAETVMARRKVRLSDADIEIFKEAAKLAKKVEQGSFL